MNWQCTYFLEAQLTVLRSELVEFSREQKEMLVLNFENVIWHQSAYLMISADSKMMIIVVTEKTGEC